MPLSPGGQPLASFVDRLLAHVVDSLITTAAAFLVLMPAMFLVLTLGMRDTFDRAAAVPPDPFAGRPPADFGELLGPMMLVGAGVGLFMLVAGYLYYVEYALRAGGRTIGKRVMKVRITPLTPTGKLTRMQLGKRFLGNQIAGGIMPLYSYVDGLWQLWDKPYQQCLHDRFAETIVIKVPAQ